MDFSKLGGLSGLMSYISPCCFALLVCAEDLLGRLTFPLLGGGGAVVLYKLQAELGLGFVWEGIGRISDG